MIEITAIYGKIYDNIFLVYLIKKEKFPVGKRKLGWEALFRHFLSTHFAKLFIILVVTNCHLFLLVFI